MVSIASQQPVAFSEFPYNFDEWMDIWDSQSDSHFLVAKYEPWSTSPELQPSHTIGHPSTILSYSPEESITQNYPKKSQSKRVKREGEKRVMFRLETEREDLPDGFRWRKYGKKTVKTNSNPRNYYKCSNGGCHVKKRVERDPEDLRFVLISYQGLHNHVAPPINLNRRF